MTLLCPVDSCTLVASKKHDVPHHECPDCRGGWFDLSEFEELEASAADAFALAGTIEYFPRPAPLDCPVCGKKMDAFDYRGNNLELDACSEEHGFWLSPGVADKVRTVMRRRSGDLRNSRIAQRAWDTKRELGFAPALVDRIRAFFRG